MSEQRIYMQEGRNEQIKIEKYGIEKKSIWVVNTGNLLP